MAKTRRRLAAPLTALLLLAAGLPARAEEESVCYGAPARGHLKGGVSLPAQGENYRAYSRLGWAAGRTFVHKRVRDTVVSAYAALATTAPGKVFIYGETGWRAGGRLRPHRSHQNGLSVDFMVPVRDRAGRSAALPTGPLDKFGYAIEFDVLGRYQDLVIDFEAIGEHLFQLHRAASRQGIGIGRVIFDPPFLSRLFQTARGAYLREHLSFLRTPAWIRHDEHYHVDFAVPCRKGDG